ncbi:MAG: porin family protein [Bacteroidales bacterium]|nr:porin family protein [Tenuifilaceae bacterium]
MKRLCLLAFFVCTWGVSSAQLFTIAGQEIGFAYIGPKIGTNFSRITNMGNASSKTGFQIGAVGEIGLTNMLSFETELVLTSKGMSTNFSKQRVNYLSIPLLAKLSFKVLGLSRVYATGGMYNNIRVNAKETYSDFNGPNESFSITDHYTVIDWGLSLGGGAAYDTKYGLLCLDLRYDLGVVDVTKDNFTTETNRNGSLGVALAFKYDAVDLFLRLRKKRLDPDAQ